MAGTYKGVNKRRPNSGGHSLNSKAHSDLSPHGEEARSAVSNHGAASVGASWFETRPPGAPHHEGKRRWHSGDPCGRESGTAPSVIASEAKQSRVERLDCFGGCAAS